MKVDREKRKVGPTIEELRAAAVNNSGHPEDRQRDLEKVMFPDFQVTINRITTGE